MCYNELIHTYPIVYFFKEGLNMPLAIQIFCAVMAFVFGSVIGSFLNVVILRTPLRQSIVTEPSHCFSCGHRLAWYDMFPIFSWLFLGGKCRYCKSKISPRYMIVESICAVLYCGTFLMYQFAADGAWHEQWLMLPYSAVLFAVLIVLSFVDIDHFEIPYWCSITIAVLGISSIWVFPETPWSERLIAAGIVIVLFGILVFIGGMGGGDLQLMAGASLLLGYRVFAALLVGIVTGSVYGVIKKLRDRKGEAETSAKIKELVLTWYENQLEHDVGFVKDGCDDIIVGSISEGEPDIEWEFLDEKVWHGLPDKSALSRALRENISDEREGGFKIYIKGNEIQKVKYSRRMVFGPFLALGIAAAWFFGVPLISWYISLF